MCTELCAACAAVLRRHAAQRTRCNSLASLLLRPRYNGMATTTRLPYTGSSEYTPDSCTARQITATGTLPASQHTPNNAVYVRPLSADHTQSKLTAERCKAAIQMVMGLMAMTF